MNLAEKLAEIRKPAKPSLGAALLGLAIVLLGAAVAVVVLGVALGLIVKIAIWVVG